MNRWNRMKITLLLSFILLACLVVALPTLVGARQRMPFPQFGERQDEFGQFFTQFTRAFDRGDEDTIRALINDPLVIEKKCTNSTEPAQKITYTEKELFETTTECTIGAKTYTIPQWQAVLGLCQGKQGLGLNIFRFYTQYSNKEKTAMARWRLEEFHSRLDFKKAGKVWIMTGGSYAYPCLKEKKKEGKSE
jgi:hypothetical protein